MSYVLTIQLDFDELHTMQILTGSFYLLSN